MSQKDQEELELRVTNPHLSTCAAQPRPRCSGWDPIKVESEGKCLFLSSGRVPDLCSTSRMSVDSSASECRSRTHREPRSPPLAPAHSLEEEGLWRQEKRFILTQVLFFFLFVSFEQTLIISAPQQLVTLSDLSFPAIDLHRLQHVTSDLSC